MPNHGTVNVFYKTQDGSDDADTDYTRTAGELTFTYDSCANDGYGGYDPQVVPVDTS